MPVFPTYQPHCLSAQVDLDLGFKGRRGLGRKMWLRGFLGAWNTLGGVHLKEKVRVGILDGIRLWMTLYTVTKNLGLTKYVERRNRKIFNRGVICITVQIS